MHAVEVYIHAHYVAEMDQSNCRRVYTAAYIVSFLNHMEAERCTFFGPLPLVYIPTVADRRRLSPKVAARRRLSPIVADCRRSETEIFAQRRKSSLMPCGLYTCAKCACEKLTFELSLDNDIKQPHRIILHW